MTTKNVLFLGSCNTARSIMAEAYMNHSGRRVYRAFSAGASPAGEIDPVAIATLRDVGVRGGNLSSKSWELFALAVAPKMDLVVTVCERLAQACLPKWPGAPIRHHWNVPNPLLGGVSAGHLRAAYLECFAELRQHIDALLLADPPLGALIEHAARGEVLTADA